MVCDPPEKLHGRAFVHWKSMWGVNLAPFQIVTMFAVPHIMPGLAKKLAAELSPGARYISNGVPLPAMPSLRAEKIEGGFYRYTKE